MNDIPKVFLDTSIFVAENFLEGQRLLSILKMGENRDIELYLSIITFKEIFNQFRKRAEEAINAHSRAINGKTDDLRVLRNNKMGKTLLRKFPKLDVVCQEFEDYLEQNLDRAKVTVLDYPKLDIGGVFDKYFTSAPPFNRPDKKSEFPDAFAQAHIEQWCRENKAKATLLTQDRDFEPDPSSPLIINHDYRSFVAEKLMLFQTMRVLKGKEINEAYLEKSKSEIIHWLTDQLHDEIVYTDIANWMEVDDITINKVEVSGLSFEVVKVDENFVTFDGIADAAYEVVIRIEDEETGIWDSEDHVMLFRENKNLQISKTVEIPFKIQFAVIDENDFDEDGEILEINDGKDLDIPSEHYY